MSARLVILVIVAGGLAVYFATRPAKTSQDIEAPDILYLGEGQGPNDLAKVEVSQQPISGVEPAEPADVQVRIEVDTADGKNRLHFFIHETHGWYVDTPRIAAWKKGPGIRGPEDAAHVVRMVINNYVRANQTFHACTDLTLAELNLLGDGIGRSEDWVAELESYGRAREKDPEPLPTVSNLSRCED